ncbi:Site-specific recombinase XerD [Nitrosospira sp. Nsp14]|uniref:tyrosine-type recombinase/integrase n=1 Tax=Nitrosospira sp. Nsp14 TaxID=1855333 RepID=UPI0008EDCBBF|nr:site-specific integrase [Nitrosospira sp. Nsp14]SFH38334.1 Site-specific recombinase XerD [Nitrosospira sp. Nsp14]
MANKINFTKAMIEGLPLPEQGKRIDFHDTKTLGLQVRVSSNGTRTFSVLRRIHGRLERVTLGRYPALTIEQARRKAAEINADIANSVNPAEVKRGRKAELTFSELFGEYLERHSKPNKKTWAQDESQFHSYLRATLGPKKISAINRSSVASIHSSITKAGQATTANRVKALVSSIFGWAISAGLWHTNPATGIKHNKEQSRDRFIQGDELPRFFRALADEQNSSMRDFFLLSLLTGARRANVLAMRWEDISLDRAEWRLRTTKNGTPQTVTLSPQAIQILRDRLPLEPTVFVFPGRGKTGHLAEPKKGWQRILSRAGLGDLRIHDLRRTLGSWQAKQGASLAIIGKSLNHKSQNTTAIYARLDLDPVRDSVNAATSAMMVAGGLTPDMGVVKFNRSRG